MLLPDTGVNPQRVGSFGFACHRAGPSWEVTVKWLFSQSTCLHCSEKTCCSEKTRLSCLVGAAPESA